VAVIKDSSREDKKGMSKNHDYIVFYKLYYRKLAKEHPRWTAAKISKIIKLLWMRRQKLVKRSGTKAKMISKEPKLRVVTGRVLFKKKKVREGINADQAKIMWR